MSLKIRYAKRKLAHVRCGAVLVAKVACWRNRSCGFCVCESLEMDADASVPLPKSVARQMNPFHRLMRSYKLGLVGMLLVTSALAAEPLVTVAPTLMILTWLGATEMRNMQRFFDLTTGWYMAIIVMFLEFLFGVRIRTFGHREKFKRRSLFIMNHICHFDWMYFWGVMERSGDITTWKVVTKSSTKKIPIVGICLQYMCHIFVSRRWELDEQEFRKKLFYYNALDLPVQLLLFPEGGDLTEKSKAKSHTYADTNGLKRYEHCLHPRARGFIYLMGALRSGQLDAVYDITVGYPDALAKTEGDFARGGCIPRDIHYNIRHFRPEDLPSDEEGLTQWLAEQWKEKEESLKLFHAHKRFVTRTGDSENGASFLQNGQSEFRPVQESTLPKSYPFTFRGLAFYISVISLSYYLLSSHWVGWCCVLGLAVFTFLQGLLGPGIDVMLPNKVQDEYAYRHIPRS